MSESTQQPEPEQPEPEPQAEPDEGTNPEHHEAEDSQETPPGVV